MNIRSSLKVALAALVLACTVGQAAAAPGRWVTVINRSSSPVFYLYVTNSANKNWGSDKLGFFGIISSGFQRNMNFDDGSGACIFDFKAVLSDGRNAIQRGVDVCNIGTWTVFDN